MRLPLVSIFLSGTTMLLGQYQFKGQVAEVHSNQTVYLSLVENYRKSARVYLDQIIQKTTADTTGHFVFSGSLLSEQNRIYRIHVDGCEDQSPTKNHFLRACPQTESLLFIASNTDTITLPLGSNDQAFCEIVSTNPASTFLLDIESLKEEMILDFIDHDSELSRSINFKKWFAEFQEFGEDCKEPLAELYIYDFLSDRTNETYATYLEELSSNMYYTALFTRLQKKYPQSKMAKQYDKELQSDLALVAEENDTDTYFNSGYLIYPALVLVLAAVGYYVQNKRKSVAGSTALSTLTAQERKIMDAILDGKSNKEIANHFYISVSTVKTHINSIYKKLGLSSRSEIRTLYKGGT
ncbi:MAG: LuxR C-terminal-related transcriptional regulator [Bacteroidota bacterium]